MALRSRAVFHTPGHKQGQAIPAELIDWFGPAVFRADLPELPELDTLFAPDGVIQSAQELAAAAFGAEQTRFLANGSSCGIEAAILATCNPGDSIILPRNVHQSAIAALILSGAIPVWLEPDYDPDWGLAHCISLEALENALARSPTARAVLIVSPTYYGVCGDVDAIAQVTHSHHLPLIVDEAHGAHFAFHPDLPTPALQAGADLVVQSTHKTLSALTQAAMLHLQGSRIDRDRLDRSLQLVQSTSPSYLLLASLDAARQQMATQGQELMEQAIALASAARAQLGQISELSVLQPKTAPGFAALDPTRLTIDVTRLGLTGFEADEILHRVGVTCELPGLRHLTFIITHGNTHQDIDRLIQAFRQLAALPSAQTALPNAQLSLLPVVPAPALPPALSPREAFFAPAATVAAADAIAQISAELVCPYPPGIPVLVPGEIITAEAIAALQHILSAGGVITGCTDPRLQTLKIVKT